MTESGHLAISKRMQESLQHLADLSITEITSALESKEELNPRHQLAIKALSQFVRLVQAQNGAQRVVIAAINVGGFDSPEERRKYIEITMPQLNLGDKD